MGTTQPNIAKPSLIEDKLSTSSSPGIRNKLLSFGTKIIKAVPRVARFGASKLLGPLGLMLGSTPAYGGSIYDEEGYDAQGLDMAGNPRPEPMSDEQMANITKSLQKRMYKPIPGLTTEKQTGGMYDQMRQYNTGGIKQYQTGDFKGQWVNPWGPQTLFKNKRWLSDPHVTYGMKTMHGSAGPRMGVSGRISGPLWASYSGNLGLRGEMDYALRGSKAGELGSLLPNEMATTPQYAQGSLGLRGIYNTPISRRSPWGLKSSIGAGFGVRGEGAYARLDPSALGGVDMSDFFSGGESEDYAGAYGDINLGLVRKLGKKSNIGLYGSYGTKYAPDPGLNLGLKGNLGRFTAGAGYDFTSQVPRFNLGYNLRKEGGVRKYGEGGPNEHMDLIMNQGISWEDHQQEEHHAGGDTSSSSTYDINNPYINPDGSPKIDYGFSLDTSGLKPIISGEGWKKIGKWGKGVWDKSSNWGKAGIIASGVGAPIAAIGSGLIDPSEWFKKGGVRRKRTGGVNLPGGQMYQIPGSDAVEFSGQKHNEGGIMMDPVTEVEDGETMDKVNVAKTGGKRDYFFSSHLKMGGKTFADIHKEILARGGNQKEINMLARMQEKAAGRDSSKVQTAKLGGFVKYQTGGLKEKPVKPQMKDFKNSSEYMKARRQYFKDLKAWEEQQTILEDTNVQDTTQLNTQFLDEYIPESEDDEYYDEMSKEIEESEQKELDAENEEKERKKKEELAALKAKAKDLGIPVGSYKVSELKSLISEAEEAASRRQRVGEVTYPGTADIPENQPQVTIGGKIYYLKDPELQKYIEDQGEDFGTNWMENLDQEVLNAAGITSFEDFQDKKKVEAYQRAWNNKNPNNKIAVDGLFGEETITTGMLKEDEGGILLDQVDIIDKKDEDDDTLILDDDRQIGPTEDITIKKEDIINKTIGEVIDGKPIKGKKKKDKDYIPRLAYLGMGAGLIPAAYSLFHKQPEAQQIQYTPGFTSPVVAERGKAPHLERYDYNQDIANVGREVRGMHKYIETSGGGPANMVNKMMAFSRGQTAKDKIRAAETRANIGVQNTEAQLKQQMDLDNMKRAQAASQFNAALAQKEIDRSDQIEAWNAAARQKRIDDMEYQKYAGMTSLGESIQTGIGDILDYKADARIAKELGSEGIYDRLLERLTLDEKKGKTARWDGTKWVYSEE